MVGALWGRGKAIREGLLNHSSAFLKATGTGGASPGQSSFAETGKDGGALSWGLEGGRMWGSGQGRLAAGRAQLRRQYPATWALKHRRSWMAEWTNTCGISIQWNSIQP